METRSASAPKSARDARALSIAPRRLSGDCALHCGESPISIKKQSEGPKQHFQNLSIVFTTLLSACATKAIRDRVTRGHTNEETPVVFLRQARQEGLAEPHWRQGEDRGRGAPQLQSRWPIRTGQRCEPETPAGRVKETLPGPSEH